MTREAKDAATDRPRRLRETGPRLEVIFSDDELANLEEGLNGAGYERGNPFGSRERRFRHPGGSTVRIFPLVGLAYVYPPGGTARQTGPIHPFTPLKRECAAANAAAGFADADHDDSAAAGDDAGTGDTPTDDDEATDGDDN